MIEQLRDKEVIFFDVGYTLDMPASGDWMFTNRFLEEAGERLKRHDKEEIDSAREAGLRFLSANHLVTSVEAEIDQFFQYYTIISDRLDLGLSEGQRKQIARDRACNMENYIPYPGIRDVLETLSRTHRLGVISDTWPSIEQQLEYLGISRYFSFQTYSCCVGVFKPDSRIYLDALVKSGVPAEKTVFIDDNVRNLNGAATLGICPILIAANPDSDVDTSYLKIRDLRELITTVRPEKGLSFAKTGVDSPDARALLQELNGVLCAMLGHNGTAHVCLDDFSHGKAFFLVGYDDGIPVCCAGVRMMDETTGEIKRVYARKNNNGVGTRLMAALERTAAEAGYRRLVLECREGNGHAIGFYRKNGYTLCAKYPPYDEEADAVCLEKRLEQTEETD